MEIYKNLSGDSGVNYFQIGADFIVVEFKKVEHLDIVTVPPVDAILSK